MSCSATETPPGSALSSPPAVGVRDACGLDKSQTSFKERDCPNQLRTQLWHPSFWECGSRRWSLPAVPACGPCLRLCFVRGCAREANFSSGASHRGLP